MKQLTALLLCMLLAACGSAHDDRGAAAALQQHPPRPDVDLQIRVVEPEGEGHVDWQGRRLALREPPLVTSADVIDVAAADSVDYPALNLSLRAEADARLRAASAGLVGQQIAVTLDDRVLTVATVHGPFGDQIQIRSGDSTQAEVEALVRFITQGGAQAQLR